MRSLTVFNNVSLDGYFVDAHGDMSWAHAAQRDPEFQAFVQENASGGGQFLFGRVTYELMAGYWPTPQAIQSNPLVAERMNSLPKVVFSRTLATASWNNTRLIAEDLAGSVRALKREAGPDIVIFGSGTLVAQLTDARLIDEYQLVVNPVALGRGRTLFEGVQTPLLLRFLSARTFGNGIVFLRYAPPG